MRQGIKKFGDLFCEASKPVFKKFGFANQKIITNWHQIVGEDIAKICSPEKINFLPNKTSGGTLIIGIPNPAFALAIQAIENRIIDKISTFFGYQAVSRIKIKILPVKVASLSDSEALKEERQIDPELQKKIEELEDVELKVLMLSLARNIKD